MRDRASLIPTFRYNALATPNPIVPRTGCEILRLPVSSNAYGTRE